MSFRCPIQKHKKKPAKIISSQSLLVLAACIGAAVAFKIMKPLVSVPENFSPSFALVFFGSYFFTRFWGIIGPVIVILLLELVWAVLTQNSPFQIALIGSICGYVAVALIGKYFMRFLEFRRKGRSFLGLFVFGFLASLSFYFITNSFAWLIIPEYTKSINGWLQAISVGLPQYQPTWTFGLQSLAGDLLFLFLFFLVFFKSSFSLGRVKFKGIKQNIALGSLRKIKIDTGKR